jgi:inosine-uridine nucleoside N-ribohydrolase
LNITYPKIPDYAIKYFRNINEQKCHFTTHIYNALKSSPKKVTIIALGPLTNIALLLLNHPDSVRYIDNILIMGGAIGVGNVGPVQEFNVWVDPEAAERVFNYNLTIFMVPLQCTNLGIIPVNFVQKVKSISTPIAIVIYQFINFYNNKPTRQGLHDPVAILALLDPSKIVFKKMNVQVETSSLYSSGQTIVDISNKTKRAKNINVCIHVDTRNLWPALLKAIQIRSTKLKGRNLDSKLYSLVYFDALSDFLKT